MTIEHFLSYSCWTTKKEAFFVTTHFLINYFQDMLLENFLSFAGYETTQKEGWVRSYKLITDSFVALPKYYIHHKLDRELNLVVWRLGWNCQINICQYFVHNV